MISDIGSMYTHTYIYIHVYRRVPRCEMVVNPHPSGLKGVSCHKKL